MKTFRAFIMFALLIALMAASSTALVNAQGPATPAATMAATAAGTAAAVDTKGWPETFIIGIFQSDDATKALAGEEPVRVYLESEIKKVFPQFRIIMYTGTSYTAVIEAMKAGRIDAFEVGPFAYILAAEEANAEALAVDVPDGGGAKAYDPKLTPYYLSVIITKKGSGIKTIADLKGKSFSFVDPASTSGHLKPAGLIAKAGLNPDQDMKTIYAGSHPASVLSVWTDKVPAGATYVGNLLQQAADKKIDLCFFPDNDQFKIRTQKEIDDLYASCKDGQIVPIAFSDPIPSTPFAISRSLPQSFRDAVKAALLKSIGNEEIIKALGGKWYVDPAVMFNLKSADNYFDGLRQDAKLLNLDLHSIVK